MIAEKIWRMVETMSKNYYKVKKYYDSGKWTKEMVWNAVGKWITAEEYELIVGEPWVNE
jgi:hypothetical protein